MYLHEHIKTPRGVFFISIQTFCREIGYMVCTPTPFRTGFISLGFLRLERSIAGYSLGIRIEITFRQCKRAHHEYGCNV